MKPAVTPQQKEFTDSDKSKLSLYKELAVGDVSTFDFAYYEFCNLFFSGLSGLVGFGMRSIFYPKLFSLCGNKSAFGKGLVLRNPAKISIGNKVLIDDYVALDVRGKDSSITIEDYVCIGRYTTVAAKHGSIKLSAGVNIGSYCRVATNSKIEIGESVLIGAYAYIGPGNHRQDEDGKSLIESSMDIKGGVKIGSHAWIGARATILDGVTIGEGAIVGAHSFVREDVPAGSTVAGTPARIILQK